MWPEPLWEAEETTWMHWNWNTIIWNSLDQKVPILCWTDLILYWGKVRNQHTPLPKQQGTVFKRVLARVIFYCRHPHTVGAGLCCLSLSSVAALQLVSIYAAISRKNWVELQCSCVAQQKNVVCSALLWTAQINSNRQASAAQPLHERSPLHRPGKDWAAWSANNGQAKSILWRCNSEILGFYTFMDFHKVFKWFLKKNNQEWS